MRIVEFALASALVELTPGPNMGYLAALAASRGAGAGLRTTAGIATGIAAVGVLCAFGLAELVAGHPTLDRALRWAGAVFMLWLAFDAFVHAGAAATGGAGDLSTFRRGLTTNLMNPKLYAFFVGVLPDFLDPPGGGAVQQTLALVAIYVAIATAIHAAIVGFAGRAHALLSARADAAAIDRAMAGLLLAVALWLGWEAMG